MGLLKSGAALGEASGGAAGALTFDDVIARAREAADRPHQAEPMTLVPPFDDLGYNDYRAIRMRREADPLEPETHGFAMDLLPPGFLYRDRVSIAVVGPEGVRDLTFDPRVFEFDPSRFDNAQDAAAEVGVDLAYSGFRLRHAINRPDVLDEFVVFQGASYFRAIARDMIYGLSARGLAIGTADPQGEEYPVFSRFWIMEPDPGARGVTVFALLESASCTGAFAFEIEPGASTVMQTRVRLFPRVEIASVGLAPLTSMYFFGPAGPGDINDFRPAVHDSEGLQMVRGDGTRLWRPLANPRRVQTSAFVDEDPKGFGLIQRHRDFAFYQDDEARYDRRPSAWVEPIGSWGAGAVMLVEIPVDNEFNDNIVAFWRPREPLGPTDEGHAFDYRLHWGAGAPDAAPLARIAATRTGTSIHADDREVMVIDFEMDQAAAREAQPNVWASAGEVSGVALRPLPGAATLRLSFELAPGDAETIDLLAHLHSGDEPISERWLYKWSSP